MSEAYIGEIRAFPYTRVPLGWLPCQGQLLHINQFQELFSIIGSYYGGDGRTSFGLPNLVVRTPVHVDSVEVKLGTAAGSNIHFLNLDEMPEHTHRAVGSSAAATAGNSYNSTWASTGSRKIYAQSSNVKMSPKAVKSAGATQPHGNMQPYAVVAFCIAYKGTYPPRA